MAKKMFLCDIDLNGNKLQNVALEQLDANPVNPVMGQLFYYVKTENGVTTKEVRYYDGSNWISIEALNAAVIPANVQTLEDVAAKYQQNGIPVGYTFEQFINDVFRKVLERQNPSPSTLPTVSLAITNGGTVEVDPSGNNDVSIVISEGSFNQGKIGTMSVTMGESESTETRQDSGCSETANTLKIYNADGSQQLNTTGQNLVVNLTATSEGTQSTGQYKGTVEYGASSATAVNSYGENVTSEFAIAAGTTADSALTPVKSLKATYYFFTNAFASKPSSESTVHSMRAVLDKVSSQTMYSNPTSAAGALVFEYPASWNITVLFKQLDGSFQPVTSDEYEVTDGYVTLPTGGSTSAFTPGTGGSGTLAYKKWTSVGNIGAREYKITLA